MSETPEFGILEGSWIQHHLVLIGLSISAGAALFLYAYRQQPTRAITAGEVPLDEKAGLANQWVAPPGWRTTHPLRPLHDLTFTALYSTNPIPYRPYKPTKYHMTMGLSLLDINNFIQLDRTYPSRILRRQALIHTEGDNVRKCLPKGIDAVEELYEVLMRWYLPTKYPQLFTISDKGGEMVIVNYVTGHSHPVVPATRNFPPENVQERLAAAEKCLEILAEMVEEDLLFLLPRPSLYTKGLPEYILSAFTVCFPSGINAPAILGKNIKEIHGPVPRFAESIGSSMEKFFPKISPEKAWRRWNWTVTSTGELFDFPGREGKGNNVQEFDPAEDARLRVEYQTLTRLPRSGAVLFTIRTYLTPLKEIRDGPPPVHKGTEARPEPGWGTPSGRGGPEDLIKAIRGLDTDLAEYKRFRVWGDKVVKYLSEKGEEEEKVVAKENVKEHR